MIEPRGSADPHADAPAETLEVSADELYALIGRQLVEIRLLRALLEAAMARTGLPDQVGPRHR